MSGKAVKNPTLSKGNIRIQLVQKYDVPMVYSDQEGTQETDTDFDQEDILSTSASSGEERPSAQNREEEFPSEAESSKIQDPKTEK